MKNLLKNWLIPSSLMARLQVLVIVPILLILSLNAYIFFERHWHEVQLVLVRSVVKELAHVINYPAPLSMEWRELVGTSLDLDIVFTPDGKLPLLRRITDSTTDQLIAAQMQQWVRYDFDVDTSQEGKRVYFWVQLPDGLMEIAMHRKRVESFTIRLMAGFVFFSAVLFILIAALFMRKQVQPLVALTRHIRQEELPILKARSRDAVPNFGYSGATEVQELTRAFAEFQNRQFAVMRERSEMLHGISHDLRTPLTRMKLQLEMLDQDPEVVALQRDVDSMSRMLEGYLEFVAQNSLEEPETISVVQAIETLKTDWMQEHSRLHFPDSYTLIQFADSHVHIFMRPQLLVRAFDNVVGNALRYGTQCWVRIQIVHQEVCFVFCDDGSGIPASEREKVLAPFYRLDSARRSHTGGTGLGLALVQETMIMHNGSLELSDAPEGGLQVVLRLPIVAS